MENDIINKLEEIHNELKPLEKKGLDTSSLKIFIKNLKEFTKLNNQTFIRTLQLTFEEKLDIIKTFLEDRKAFQTINDVINFANQRLNLEFKDQKESRDITISRIIGRIKSKPELKETLKDAVLSIRNEMIHIPQSKKSKKQIITSDTFSKWADIIKNI